MPVEPGLLTTQRRFMAALREPIFGESRERTDLTPRAGRTSRTFTQTAESLIAPSTNLSAVDRLELYHRQYWYRLLDSIAEDFPVLRRLLGEAAFWRLMEAYLEAGPSRSFTLRHLGERLADFIAVHPNSVPHPAHAGELARLEYALCLAFEAGDCPPVSPTHIGAGVLGLQPHITLLALHTPADSFWHAAERGRRPPQLKAPTTHPTRFVAVFRHQFELQVERLPKLAFWILSAIGACGTLDEAMERVAQEQSALRGVDFRRVGDWFTRWTARGWFIRPLTPEYQLRKQHDDPLNHTP